MKEIIKELLVAVDQGIKVMRECKYHMKIRGIDYLCPALIHPEFLIDSLAVGAAAVFAGIVVDLCIAAVGALAERVSERTIFTVHDRMCRFFLNKRRNE